MKPVSQQYHDDDGIRLLSSSPTVSRVVENLMSSRPSLACRRYMKSLSITAFDVRRAILSTFSPRPVPNSSFYFDENIYRGEAHLKKRGLMPQRYYDIATRLRGDVRNRHEFEESLLLSINGVRG